MSISDRNTNYETYSMKLEKELEVLKTESEKKKKELTQICFDLTEIIYRFLGEFYKTEYNQKQKILLSSLKEAADLYIKDDSLYKDYLRKRFIDKDAKFDEIAYNELTNNLSNKMTEDLLEQSLKEDDTETLVVIEDNNDNRPN